MALHSPLIPKKYKKFKILIKVKENFNFLFLLKHRANYDSIDHVLFFHIKNTPNKLYHLNNMEGHHSNIFMNVTHGHFCKGYTSNNCEYRCNSIGGVEYCAYDSGERLCINDAIDKNTCEKNITLFHKKKFKCNKNICNNNGLCFIHDNKITCKCQPWYKGKYCEQFYCQDNCNQNGYCVSPNKCSCYNPYRGQYCSEYPCSFEHKNECKNDGKFKN
ncbi:hypothetical protein HZS_2348 [Henneguya salminicola]|nr:hypothetical protein HZS_2348 [Henneguya salminicola]